MSVFGLVSGIAGFVKVRFLQDKEIIDNAVFRFHYRVTSAILFLFCILCTANSLIGNPIDCLVGNEFKDKEKVINTYCWITSTFTLPRATGEIGTHLAAPGVAPLDSSGNNEPVYHSYYQWVPFVLFLQGILFYMPHWFWKSWEEGKIRNITDGLRGPTIDISETKDSQKTLVKYLVDTMHFHNGYAFSYVFCELLNLMNVVGNIYFVDKFLGGIFLTYGTKVIEFSTMEQSNRTDPMIALFPRITKCTVLVYGNTGTIQDHDYICVLPVNILNEKIFIFMWFWFILLSALSALTLFYSIIIMIYPPLRKFVLARRFRYRVPNGISSILEKAQLGDYFVLHLLGRNICVTVFHEILNELSEVLHDYKPIM
ncbi:hypothetical protein L9F63_012658 [Diploptera punctata]|uniref:Innexin n=1 Tax=Diploptera punctata TaxID=6984 RepID=A0AAD8ACS6_DIPPU|nr:hypothetical protein L9F63_012658 [Diploptera punctata]